MFIFSQLSPMGEYAQSGTAGMGTTGANPESSLFATFFSTCLDQTNIQENAWGTSDSFSGSAREYDYTNDSKRENFSAVAGENQNSSGSVTDDRRESDTNMAAREAASTTGQRDDVYCDDRRESAQGTDQGDVPHKDTETSASAELSGKEESGTADAAGEGSLNAAPEENESFEADEAVDAARAQVVLDWLAGLLDTDSGESARDVSGEERLLELGFSETEAKDILDLLSKQGMTVSGKQSVSPAVSLDMQAENSSDTLSEGLTKDDLVLLESIVRRMGERATKSGMETGNSGKIVLEQSVGVQGDLSLAELREMLQQTSDMLNDYGIRKNDGVPETSSAASGLSKAMSANDPDLVTGQALSATSGGNEYNARTTSGTVKDVLSAKVELEVDMQSQGNPTSAGNENGSQGSFAGFKDGFDRTEKMVEAGMKSGIDGKTTEVRGESLTSTEKVTDLAGSRDIQNLIKNGDRSVKEQSALSRKVLDQVETGAFKNLSQGKKQLTLQLNPGDLGKVQVVLQVKGKDVEAVLRTSNEDTTRILGEQMTQLKDTLEKQGLRVVKLDVQNQAANDARSDQWGGASEHNQSREQQEASLREHHWRSLRGGSEELAPEMHIPSQQVKTSLWGVDLLHNMRESCPK